MFNGRGSIPCYMGGRGGAPFKGPIKPVAQRKLEDMLITRDLPSIQVEERKCYNPGCVYPADLRCSRCCSAWYCSKGCQAAHYREDSWGSERHKRECGQYYPPSDWKAASAEAKEYKEKHGHYPGEVVWFGVRRLTGLAMASLRKANHPLVSGRSGDITAADLVAEVVSMSMGTEEKL